MVCPSSSVKDVIFFTKLSFRTEPTERTCVLKREKEMEKRQCPAAKLRYADCDWGPAARGSVHEKATMLETRRQKNSRRNLQKEITEATAECAQTNDLVLSGVGWTES